MPVSHMDTLLFQLFNPFLKITQSDHRNQNGDNGDYEQEVDDNIDDHADSGGEK